MKKIAVTSLLIAATVAVSGCAPRIGGSNYSVRGAGEVSETNRGVIISMRTVQIGAKTAEHENDPGAGALVGGVAGAMGGSQIGAGRGNVAATVGGAVLGAVAGHFAERALTDQEGFEYTVRLDNGRIVTIAQGAEPRMGVGQRVLVIKSYKDRGRIVPDNSGY
ncbi:MAG TPA: glycine zipper 2TM domain-containing protein [Candidatus Nitrosotenuis sp.]|nr:glycine zipper 2TM domain-containing protein [Candidatus Nitrosotenuis sp.]